MIYLSIYLALLWIFNKNVIILSVNDLHIFCQIYSCMFLLFVDSFHGIRFEPELSNCLLIVYTNFTLYPAIFLNFYITSTSFFCKNSFLFWQSYLQLVTISLLLPFYYLFLYLLCRLGQVKYKRGRGHSSSVLDVSESFLIYDY